MPQSEKAIIWTIFIKNAEQLKEYLQLNNIKSELLLGYVNQDEREFTTVIISFHINSVMAAFMQRY
jgi:hypothetical protein